MMKKIKNGYAFFTILICISCSQNFLEIKPNKVLVVPQNLVDFEALLDNTDILNYNVEPLGEVSSDDYYLGFDIWQSLYEVSARNAYTWASDIFEEQAIPRGMGWLFSYRKILYANIVLEGLEKINKEADKQKWENLKGSALFYRSWAFFQLSQIFGFPYHEIGNNSEYGIPLRLESDINSITTRATVKETYEQMISDLEIAIQLLPEIPLITTRPSRPAAHALLAKIYLQMNEFELALIQADNCLQLKSSLMDYNLIDNTLNFPFEQLNTEVIFHATLSNLGIFQPARLIVDSLLFNLYEDNDIRKKAFFIFSNGYQRFKGSYSGSDLFFAGIATDEIYLIRAECNARLGNVDIAIKDLNHLLIHRYEKEQFTNFYTNSSEEVITRILKERRKQLVFRGIRWHDLRRFNLFDLDNSYQSSLVRNLNGQLYTLPPNDLRYILPIPNEVIALTGIKQNPR